MQDIIICDTREKHNLTILKYFDKVGKDYIISKLDAGDYMLYKRPEVIIDKKDNLLELCGNLTQTKEHERIKRELSRAKENGCRRFIFLVCDSHIHVLSDVKTWSNINTRVSGETLYKVLKTMIERYEFEVVFCGRKDFGKNIIEILGGEK
ncbi:MAG: ERCC4 domain-containing protein [Bacilli bacterium]